jgi:hypothetical protein
MIVRQWVYRDYRIELALLGGEYLSLIYEPGNPEKLTYTPVVEMKHGQPAAEAAIQKFVDERLERKTPTCV